MRMRKEWRIDLYIYKKCRLLGTDIFITGNCSIKKIMLSFPEVASFKQNLN